jgi:hypothetical protein
VGLGSFLARSVIAVVVVAYAVGALFPFIAWDATAVVVLFLPAGVTVSALLLTRAAPVAVDPGGGRDHRGRRGRSQGLALSDVWGFAVANTRRTAGRCRAASPQSAR